MIKSIKLINFRNFENKIIEGFCDKNFIIGENGKGKTNILEAIAKIGNNSINKLNLEDLVKINEDYFFIEIIYSNSDKHGFYYSKKEKKKNFLINDKKTSKKEFTHRSHSCVIFSPMLMNMLYLSPSLRRDFLDETLKSSYPEYEITLKEYKKILKSRNSTLKAISENKASYKDIEFWDKKFINIATQIYHYRLKFIKFIEESIVKTKQYFLGKIEIIDFKYITKIDRNNIESSIQKYLEENIKRDIILSKTHIGPHVDDFEIRTDNIDIKNFASRGEVKSMIIYLKLIEGIFIEKITGKKPILIIDDLISELDEQHKNMIMEKINYYQSFISNIQEIKGEFIIKV